MSDEKNNPPPATVLVQAPPIELSIDDRRIVVPADTTIFDAARMYGIRIPTLCHQQNERPSNTSNGTK